MEFGRLSNIDQVDFTFPESHPGTAKILGGTKSKTLHVHVGIPVWSDPGFPGKIYPLKAQAKDFVKHYGTQFNSIELNATHYRIPELTTVRRWAAAVPTTFKFCPKIPQSISHSKDISQCITEMNYFCEVVSGFEEKLGTCFLQLPPYFEVKQLNLLLNFLDHCPLRDVAVELRHESWFKDERALNDLSNYLYKKQFTFNITDVAGRRDVLHQRLTNKTAFVRFVANNLHASDFKRLDDWVERLTAWIDQGLEQVYFFMHTPDKSLTPELAIYFINSLNKVTGLNVNPPVIQDTGKHHELF